MAPEPKVIHLNDKICSAGGVEVYLEQLQGLLPQFGWTTDWFGLKRKANRIAVVRYGSPDWQWEGNPERFRKFVQSMLTPGRAAVLHVHSISDPQIIRILSGMAPIVRTMHEPRMFCPGQGKFWSSSETACSRVWGLHCLYDAYRQRCASRDPRRLFSAWLNTWFETRNASVYSLIIANSQFIKQEAVLAGFPESKLTILPYFAEAAARSDIARTQEPMRILFVGRLSRTKGLHYLLRAFALLLKHVPAAKLDIAGSGIDREFFFQLSRGLGLSGSVSFHGWCDRKRVCDLMEQSYVVAFPSIYPEAFGIVGIEAMMHSRPVVAFDTGGVRDWLRHGETGLLVRAKDVEGFTTALRVMIEDRHLHAMMSRRAKEVAEREFCVERHLGRLTGIYQNAIALWRRQ